MATFTYLSFTQNQEQLVANGGPWGCAAFGGPCNQDGSGPITGTSNLSGTGTRATYMSLDAEITLGNDELVGAKTITATISFNIQATAQGGSPELIHLTSMMGGATFPYGVSVQYNDANPTFATHTGTYSGRPATIPISIEATISDFHGATVTITFSNLNFEIHDVVYSTTSTVGSSTSSVSSSTSSSGSSSTLPTNSTTSVSRSTSFTTTISGQEIVIGSTLPESSSNSGSQSQLPSPNTPNSNSMTANERAAAIAGTLVGLGLIIIGIAIWYQWRRRRRTKGSVENRRRPYSHTITTVSILETAESEVQEVPRRPLHRHERAPSYHVGAPPPAYSQISPRSVSRSITSSTDG